MKVLLIILTLWLALVAFGVGVMTERVMRGAELSRRLELANVNAAAARKVLMELEGLACRPVEMTQ